MRHPTVSDIVRRDSRYAYDAYEFLYRALRFTQDQLGIPPQPSGKEEAQRHVSGRQLLDGIRELAAREFGRMARVVLKNWGINQTEDFGNMVFNLVEAGLLYRRPEDTLDDFRNAYDLDEALVRDYEFRMEETE